MASARHCTTTRAERESSDQQAGFQDSDAGTKRPLLQADQDSRTSRTQPQNLQSSRQRDSDQYAPTRVDTLASYGQLVTPHTFEDAPQASQQEIQPQQTASSSKAGPSSSSTVFSQRSAEVKRPHITGTDPVKHTEKSLIGVNGGFVMYAVASRIDLPKYSSRGATVRRRFRDFVVSC